MELREYLRIARRRWILILLCVILAVGLVAVLTLLRTSLYSSAARLFVSARQSDTADAYQGGLFSAERVTSYAQLVTGEELSRRVVDRLHLPLGPSDLTERIQASVVPDTVIIEVTAADSNPTQAQRLAQAVAEELIRLIDELETPRGQAGGPIKATIIDPASLPTRPVSPQPVRDLSIAAILGLLLGVALAGFREALATSVRSQDDVLGATDVSVMGSTSYSNTAADRQ